MWGPRGLWRPEVYAQIQRAVADESAVLIQGEAGTGKALIAHQIHAGSPRNRGPFLSVECSVTVNSVGSLLFGGTGRAAGEREGCICGTDGGTLLLSDVHCLPLDIQPKVLNVIQAKSLTLPGGTVAVQADVRIIAASDRDLASLVVSGAFDEGLYDALTTHRIDTLPLRDRPTEIVPLAQQFLDALAVSYQDGRREIADDASRMLETYAWPGNARELADVIERAHHTARTRRIDTHVLKSLLPDSSE